MERIDDEQMDIVPTWFETRSLCYGGTFRVSEVAGVACSTIGRGRVELDGSVTLAAALSRSLNSGLISCDSTEHADRHATRSVGDH